MISEYHMKHRDSSCVSEIIYGLSFYLYKKGSKLIFYTWDEFEYGFGMCTHIFITHPVAVFWYQEKSKPIPKRSQNGENPSNWVWFRRIYICM